ncbi:CPBP family intramembrane glutamic endopeptidase [Cohnella endophytica]|uniref:CPBP family intramembrane glutamic endopeptidase n=1 Tax=Cohnella endophytica TaxID=2419778 RepID=UPI0013149302|nr:CPBP family intramembrane glutamic endopeptidase [Cohnella endophytica]
MNRIVPSQLDKRWLWTATIGFLLFLLIQVFPVTGQLFSTDTNHVLTRTEANVKALEWASDRFGLARENVEKTTVTHLSDSDTVGYLTKYELVDAFDKQWSATAPRDVYAVEIRLRDTLEGLVLYLDMDKGKLVAWQTKGNQSSEQVNSDLPADNLADRAMNYAMHWGVQADQWKWDGQENADGSVRFVSALPEIGQANPWLKVAVPNGYSAISSAFPPWQGGSVTYGVDLPASFTGYMDKQEHWAMQLSIFGFILPSLLMFVIAIVYTGTHGEHTSYRRGIFLSVIFFALYAGLTFNMIPGLRAGTWKMGASLSDNVSVIASLITYAAMALLTYFSAVGGDGLWRSMGRSLWPRWKEAGYGNDVLNSMRIGYFLAFILLGAQSFILLVLEKSLGSFSSSDASQSMYNMSIPWLLPLLAWCAGISEELQSRLFGIGLFRSWFVGTARKLLGREPSHRTASILTIAAIVPPGLLWALGHVGYAIYPFYTRIIELVLMSFLFGWFMLRFGIMAAIFAHVTLDAILMGLQMMFDGLPYDFIGGVFSIAMPAIVAIAIWWLHRTFRREAKTVES